MDISKKKVLVVLDYVKLHYVGTHADGTLFNKFSTTADGQYIRGMVGSALKEQGIDTIPHIEYAFTYPKVPPIVRENKREPSLNTYKPPLSSEIKEGVQTLLDKISNIKPDLIITAGTITAKALLGSSSISKVRGSKQEIEIDDKSYPTLVTYAPAYILSNPDSKRFSDADFKLIAKYISEGEHVFDKKETQYVILTNQDEDKVIKLLDFVLSHGNTPEDAFSWDYETNSLSGIKPGSKILTVSVSTQEGSGFTFPIDHPEQPWSPEARQRVVSKWLEVLHSTKYKVGHNVSFDMRQTKTTLGPVDFVNTLDTMVAFYIAVSQSSLESKGLKELANQYTDMGGYDSALDTFKHWFSLGFATVGGKDLKPIYEKTYVEKVYQESLGNYVITNDDYLPFINDEQKQVVHATATRLVNRFVPEGSKSIPSGAIRNEQDESENFDYGWIPYKILAWYACGDVDATKRINNIFVKMVSEDEKFYELYTSHYPKLLNSLSNIEARGVTLDVEYLKEVNSAFSSKMDEIYKEMLETEEVKAVIKFKQDEYIIGLEEKAKPVKERDADKYKKYTAYRNEEDREFQPTKNLDVHYALFKASGYQPPVEKKFLTPKTYKALSNKKISEEDVTYMDYATNHMSVSYLVEQHPDFKLAELFQTYTRLNKLQSTYTESLIEKTDANNKIHGRYSATGTETTRLASKDPNMQNISKPTNVPTDADYDYPIKNAFVPHYDLGQDTIINLDFSSQEAHLAAVVAHDEGMIDSFLNHADVHKATAALMYNITPDEVTKDQRFSAKSTTFGLMYGMAPMTYKEGKFVNDEPEVVLPNGDKKQHPMTTEEAEEIFAKYFAGKPKIKGAIDLAQEEVKKTGKIRIPASGFVRNLGEIYSVDYSKRSRALRQAFNTIIQGSSSYLTQLAIIAIDTYLMKSDINASLIITVHDSITLSASRDDVDKAATVAKYIMEHLPVAMLNIVHNGEKIYFPMEAEVQVGGTYAYEFDYDKEDFYSFKSTKGFTEYYKAVKLIDDRREAKMITPEEYDSELSELKSKKEMYQNIA